VRGGCEIQHIPARGRDEDEGETHARGVEKQRESRSKENIKRGREATIKPKLKEMGVHKGVPKITKSPTRQPKWLKKEKSDGEEVERDRAYRATASTLARLVLTTYEVGIEKKNSMEREKRKGVPGNYF